MTCRQSIRVQPREYGALWLANLIDQEIDLAAEYEDNCHDSGIPGTSMISFVKGKTEISLNFPNRHR